MSRDAGELAGRVIMTGIPGPVLDAETGRVLERMRPSGIILFKRNVVDVDQLCRLTADLHRLPWHPLVAIDHEGGRVMRVEDPFTHFQPARCLARTGEPELVSAVGQAMGRELSSVGIDIDFSPVLDVDSNPKNPIIGDRAFGATPRDVERFGLAMARGLHLGGVLPCGKHFPGHGDTDCDSHVDLPVVARSRDELRAVELPPFQAAIAARIPMLMTAHVRYAALDAHHPATLSSAILQDLLRRELGFSGVVVTDDLEMKGISAATPVPEAALEALRAGADWLLICNDFDLSRRAAERIAEAVVRGELEPAVVDRAAARIASLSVPPCAMPSVTLPVPAHRALKDRIGQIAAALGNPEGPS